MDTHHRLKKTQSSSRDSECRDLLDPQEAALAGSSENGLRLAQAVHLLVERRLAGVEVVEREVAALVEVRVLVHELLQLVERSGQLLLRRNLILLSHGLLL